MADTKNGGGEAPSLTARDQSPRNEDDAQSNQQNHISTASEIAPSKATSKASSTRNSTPAAASQEVRQSAQDSNDASSAMEDVQQSLEAENPASNQMQSLTKDSEQDGDAPSSYGTRSRGRPGRSRPNYAEDTEMDFEMGAAPANGNVSDPPSRNSMEERVRICARQCVVG
jgi:hypothetical protein